MSGDWRLRVEQELTLARASAAQGNQAKARVGARRAAGWAAQAYLEQQGQPIASSSVLDQLRGLQAQPGLPPRVTEIAEHLLTIKKKDHPEDDSYFPLEVDLVAEAGELIALLYPTTKTGS